MSKALTTLPARRSGSCRAGRGRRACCGRAAGPRCSGAPTWSVNSSGAAPVPPSAPSTTMKSGRMPVSSIALTMPEPFPRVADAQLEADRLAAGERAQLLDELHHLDRRREGAVRSRRDAVDARATPRAAAISGVTFGPGRTPPWPGLAPCDSLISIIFTCGSSAFAAKRSSLNEPSLVAAAEVAGADLPDQVAAMLAVIPADRALAGVVREAAALGAGVEREDRVAPTARRSSSPRC